MKIFQFKFKSKNSYHIKPKMRHYNSLLNSLYIGKIYTTILIQENINESIKSTGRSCPDNNRWGV